MASALNVAQAIERLGMGRGLFGHLHAAEMALQGIYQRAMYAGTWRCTSLYYQELEKITSMVDLHKFQLDQVSYCEFRHAVYLVKTHVTSQPRASQEIS